MHKHLRMTHDTLVSWLLWWSQSGSNRRPSRCKRDALPAELWPHSWKAWHDARDPNIGVVGLGGVEPPTSPLSGVRSNQLSYRPGGQASGGPASRSRGLTN